jgi:S-adenosylmethionine:diacylglycerol 3-amino-3-carboxypropyl transferase
MLYELTDEQVDLLKAAPFMPEGVLEDLWDEIKSAVEALDHPVDITVDLATQWHRGYKAGREYTSPS